MRKPAKADRPAAPGPAFNPEQLASALAAMLTPPQPVPEPEPEEAPTEVEPAAYDVPSFCRAHHISRSKFFALRAEDRELEQQLGRPLLPSERKAPRCKEIGAKLIISREEAARWRNG